MANTLSFSRLSTYMTCGKKYELQHIHGLREKYASSALLFGSAIDSALNSLLVTRDLELADVVFYESWKQQTINNVLTQLKHCELIQYSEKDFDRDLFPKGKDFTEYDEINILRKDKKPISIEQQKIFNSYSWESLFFKGNIILKSYYEKILPRVLETLSVQEKFQLKNDEGDVINSIADAVLKWEDGRIILFDNKTSSVMYKQDQAATATQLITYYHALKDKYKIDAVGYIVMDKTINKNKIKICSKCGFEGTGKNHKTCFNETSLGRCHGTWLENCSSDCDIYPIINNVSPIAEALVMSTFQEANEGIKNKVFNRNLNACSTGFTCPYFKKCWNNSDDGLIKTERKY